MPKLYDPLGTCLHICFQEYDQQSLYFKLIQLLNSLNLDESATLSNAVSKLFYYYKSLDFDYITIKHAYNFPTNILLPMV